MNSKLKIQWNNHTSQAWLASSVLTLFALLYCFSALSAPFWSGNDTWSNLLPIIHLRHSILEQHTLPLFTDLWYGGRPQWANPLWNFLYIPSTIIWLITPLDWGTRIVFLSHLLFSLLIGRKLAGLFLETELEKVSSAILLSSPILPALIAGHIEKVMAWGWILLALFYVFNEKLTPTQRGLGSGMCLGVIPIVGANYYTLFAGILLVPLIFSCRNHKLWAFFILGSLTGLVHLPSVLSMVGHARMYADYYIEIYSVNFLGVLLALATGFPEPMGWETWAAIGIPVVCLFGFVFAKRAITVFLKGTHAIPRQNVALIISITVLILFATGIAYLDHDLFDLFRVPARSLGFIALGFVLYIFVNLRSIKPTRLLKRSTISLFIVASTLQVVALAWFIRPEGSPHSPYEESVQDLADILKADQAKSVWISTKNFNDMYIHVGLTRNNLALPNVYYGDLGQIITTKGDYCGYSFDHLLVFAPVEGSMIHLRGDEGRLKAQERIPLSHLILVKKMELNGNPVSVYRVGCDDS